MLTAEDLQPHMEKEVPLEVTDLPIDLEPEHKRIIGLVTAAGVGEWDHDKHLLIAHTIGLQAIHDDPANKIRGDFVTDSTGSSLRNCWMRPNKGGGWTVFRYGKGTQEHSSWHPSRQGWTCCSFNEKQKSQKNDPAAQIVRQALSDDQFFHSPDGLAYATVKRGHSETYLVREEGYAQILRLRYTDSTGQVAKQEHLRNAIAQLEAVAIHDRPEYLVYLRVAPGEGKIYLDLADADRNIVEITADGLEHR